MVEEGERASRRGLSARALFFCGAGIVPFAARTQVLDGPCLALAEKQGRHRYGTAVHARYCTLQLTDGLWAQAWPLNWSCSFQLWCACSRKAGILPSTALIRL